MPERAQFEQNLQQLRLSLREGKRDTGSNPFDMSISYRPDVDFISARTEGERSDNSRSKIVSWTSLRFRGSRPTTFYKFVALSGVLLVIVGYGIPAYSLVRSSSLARPILREQVERIARQKVAISQYERSTAAYKKNDAAAGRALYDSASHLNDSLKRTSALADQAYDEVKEDRDLLADFARLGFVLVAIGAFCAIWGFANWYTRLQKPLDEILQREAEELKSRANS